MQTHQKKRKKLAHEKIDNANLLLDNNSTVEYFRINDPYIALGTNYSDVIRNVINDIIDDD